MIKIKLKQSNMLTEVSARYLMDAFKVPQEFAEMVNQQYRQNGDSLVEVFIGQFGKTVVEKPIEELKQAFEHFMKGAPTKVGEMFDIVLKKYPAKKKELIELSTESFWDFVRELKSLECKSLLPKEVFRIAKEEYRDNQNELIELFCLWSTRTGRVRISPEQLQERFLRFMDQQGTDYDEMMKKFPDEKESLLRMARTNWDIFEDRIYALKRKSEETPVLPVIEFPDGMKWINLQTEYCSDEATRMGHCGAASYGGKLYSLRKQHGDKEKSYVTIEFKEDTKEVFQIKGPQNTFPTETFWPYIYKFIEHFGVTEDGIQEPLATDNEDFMKVLAKEEGNFEDDLTKLSEQARLADEAYGTEGLDNLRKIRKILKRVFKKELSPEQVVQVYSASYIKKDGIDGNLETFSAYYPKENSLEYDLEVVDGIFEYNKSNGVFKTPDDIRALTGFMLSKIYIIEKIRNKDLNGVKPVKYLMSLPIMKKIESAMNDLEEKEKAKEVSESKKRLYRISKNKFKMDHRGYFRL